ncbi:energy-coupling factor transporter transmembrane protein EcfT [candidate division TA06 bacterium]|uniref:Energy-coupling factor transporter transmembrane protein EcfT n=1 Tax=candidate division TA06 bacterium TaxID=2250710 RepID=A0A933I8N4_UNCT6|nr:energy-coupling factor transporter transmembrane protein EcfT [candidate division TA06 bacterium]
MIRYYENKTILHLLDPRIKIIWTMVISVLIVMNNIPLVLGLLFLSTAIVWLAVRPPLGKFKVLLFTIITIIAGTIFSQAVFYYFEPKTILLTILPKEFPFLGKLTGGINIYREGIAYGLIQSLRILSAVSCGTLTVMTTHPSDLVLGLTKFKMPERFSFMLLVTFRFLPELIYEAKRILLAQRLRGLQPAGVNGAIKAFRHLMTPLIINTLRNARQLALAAEVRGYSGRRIPVRQLKFSHPDFMALGILTLL